MKWLDRWLMIINSIGLALLSLVCLFSLFGVTPAGWAEWVESGSYSGILLIIVCAFFLFSSIRFLLNSLGLLAPRQTIVHKNDNGEVNISLGAIENLLNKVARGIYGIKDAKSYVFTEKNGELSVRMRIVVTPEAAVPKLADDVQNAVKLYVKDIVGVEVTKVRVMVDNITAVSKNRVE